MPGGRRPIIRERNERGFTLFLQNLKGVINLFVSPDVAFSSTQNLIEIRQRLLDASGTLALLVHSRPNAAGMNLLPIQRTLQDLNNQVRELIQYLSTMIQERDDTDYHDTVEMAYAAPINIEANGAGRKRLEISQEQLEHLRSLFFSWTKIAKLLGVSTSTLQRRRREFGMAARFEEYSELTDDELDDIYKQVTTTTDGGPLTPNIGRRRFIGALRSRGLRVQRWRVSDCLRRMDPIGTALRWRMLIHRRKYFVPYPNSLWHIDSCHKLIRYKIIIHVCVDGKTRSIIYASCRNNNKAETVLALFENGVQRWGLPSRVRSDYGMENYLVGCYMIQYRGLNRGSIITGSSVHNCRVERMHRDVYSGVLVFYSNIFQDLEHEGLLDVLNDVNLFSLHHVFIPRIERSLQEFVDQMNHRPVSTERNLSPLQMWESGMLENFHSEEPPLTESEIEEFGIDPDSVFSVEEEDYQVNISEPNFYLTDDQLRSLPDPMLDDGAGGRHVYQECNRLLGTFDL